jgi:hypothetical protein
MQPNGQLAAVNPLPPELAQKPVGQVIADLNSEDGCQRPALSCLKSREICFETVLKHVLKRFEMFCFETGASGH